LLVQYIFTIISVLATQNPEHHKYKYTIPDLIQIDNFLLGIPLRNVKLILNFLLKNQCNIHFENHFLLK